MSWPRCTIPPTAQANAGALRAWNGRASRFPVGRMARAEDAAASTARSAVRGRELARLLDTGMPAPGVTQGALRPESPPSPFLPLSTDAT